MRAGLFFCFVCHVTPLPRTVPDTLQVLNKEWLNENYLANFMHLTKVFHFCREIVCYGKKDLHLETNQTRLESGLHRLLLDDLGQIIHFFFFFWARVSFSGNLLGWLLSATSPFLDDWLTNLHIFNVMGLLVFCDPGLFPQLYLDWLDQEYGSDPKWANQSLFSRNLEFRS